MIGGQCSEMISGNNMIDEEIHKDTTAQIHKQIYRKQLNKVYCDLVRDIELKMGNLIKCWNDI